MRGLIHFHLNWLWYRVVSYMQQKVSTLYWLELVSHPYLSLAPALIQLPPLFRIFRSPIEDHLSSPERRSLFYWQASGLSAGAILQPPNNQEVTLTAALFNPAGNEGA